MIEINILGQCVSICYRTASILDVPMIFDLMSEGSVTGAFADMFLMRTGSVALLGVLLRKVVGQYFQSKSACDRCEWRIITSSNGQDLGFLMLSKSNEKDRTLELLAVEPAYRNKGIGTTVVKNVLSEVRSGERLIVHCNKYARAMQHILKRQQFKRNAKFPVPRLEEYVSE